MNNLNLTSVEGASGIPLRILAPLRGVTIRTFRRVFAEALREGHFTEVFTPFISANAGVDPLRDRELRGTSPQEGGWRLTPQFIGKDPVALLNALRRVRDAGYATADLNCGCPYPMVRNKGRGSGLLRRGDELERLVAVGCEVMGPGRFSIKARLGVERHDELLELMPRLNRYPLRFLTVHARTARQMYEGVCDEAALRRLEEVAKMPLVRNGDVAFPVEASERETPVMIGRAFIRYLATRDDARERLLEYVALSAEELSGDVSVLGRIKELLTYWRTEKSWCRLWPLLKLARTRAELESLIRSV